MTDNMHDIPNAQPEEVPLIDTVDSRSQLDIQNALSEAKMDVYLCRNDVKLAIRREKRRRDEVEHLENLLEPPKPKRPKLSMASSTLHERILQLIKRIDDTDIDWTDNYGGNAYSGTRLTLDDLKCIKNGTLEGIYVIQPQSYNTITYLDSQDQGLNWDMDGADSAENIFEKVGWYYDGRLDGSAVTGSGCDMWVVVNDKLEQYLLGKLCDANVAPQVGDIYHVNEGYDETDNLYYQVTKLVAKTQFILKPLEKKRTGNPYSQIGTDMPLHNEFQSTGEEIKLSYKRGGVILDGINSKWLPSYNTMPATLNRWNGQPNRYLVNWR